jgi:hypothetical protein
MRRDRKILKQVSTTTLPADPKKLFQHNFGASAAFSAA